MRTLMKLNEQQAQAIEALRKWWYNGNKQVFQISGAAGTGKTTLIRYLINEIKLEHDEVLFTAFVGKATLAMTRNGLNAKTLHSAICYCKDEPVLDENGNVVTEYNRRVTKRVFTRRRKIDPRIRLIVVDEGSMVPAKMADWLLKFKVPIIVLGDLNQLPPVIGDSFFLKEPDVVLTQIMRQSSESPIPYFAQNVLQNGTKCLSPGLQIGDKINVLSKADITPELLKDYDVIICGTNKTRNNLNTYIRERIYGRTQDYPVIGDKLICRENDWTFSVDDVYLINGLIGYVTDIDLESISDYTMKIDFKPEFMDNEFKNVTLDRIYMGLSPNDKRFYRSNYHKFEYGYAITCHLSQGSQYNRVLVFNESFGTAEERRKWLYTAVTRAIDKVTILI